MTSFIAACVQLNCSDNVEENLERAEHYIREAHLMGAEFISLPENATMIEENGHALVKKSFSEDESPSLAHFRQLAKALGVWLHIGSIPTVEPGEEKLRNRSFLLSPQGQIAARYDKIHLFDVDPQADESYRESNRYDPGNKPVVVDTPMARMGLTICYDIRFPYLYRRLAHMGATTIMIPAAFTEYTGKAHWHVLLRARAIENGCYIIAAAQTGAHPGNRRTFGHSMIIDPWGKILVELPEGEGIITACIDPEEAMNTRKRLPSLQHDRELE